MDSSSKKDWNQEAAEVYKGPTMKVGRVETGLTKNC